MTFPRVSSLLFLLGFFGAFGLPGASVRADDLTSAFLATFGKAPPVERHVDHAPIMRDMTQKPHGATGAQESVVDFSLIPGFLVPLQNGRYALIVNETTKSTLAGGAPENAVSIAYLSKVDGAWAVEHVWFEVGGLGAAGNAGSEVKNFGAEPIYFSTTEWCGFNSCSDIMHVLVLENAGPQLLGWIKGGAVYPVDFPDTDPPDCESYKYTALVGPPSSRSNRFSVTYEGWTAPWNRLVPKRSFRRTADVVVKGGTLVTGLQTPDCMR